MNEAPLVTFGLLSDVQYADHDNKTAFHGEIRHYRNALLCLKEALRAWNLHNTNFSNNKIQFILNLGDIIDGVNKLKAEVALDVVLETFDEFKDGPIYHLLGNHCLYNLTRDILHPKISKTRPLSPNHSGINIDTNNTPNDSPKPLTKINHHYYSFCPHPSFRFLALDSYDVSILGWPEDHPHYSLAVDILAKNNPNVEKNSAEGLTGDAVRFVAYNGQIGKEQLSWLRKELDEALELKQKVFVCSHVPMLPVIPDSPSFLWNYKDALGLLDEYPNVVAVLAGHQHDGGYVCRNGVHHVVIEAIVECAPGTNAFAIVNLFNDHMVINGFGIVQTVKLMFPKNAILC